MKLCDNEKTLDAQKSPVQVVTIKWGQKYDAQHVNSLRQQICKNSTFPIVFHCFTDDTVGLDANIMTHPLPDIKILPQHQKYIYRKEAGLCDDTLGGLTGQRVYFFDLDVVVCDCLDDVFSFPKEDEFVIINDWNTKGDHVGQASFYSWKVGTLGYVKDTYVADPVGVIDKFGTASQAYLSYMVMQKYGPLIFWPEKWCVSFKQHCLPAWYVRYFVAPQKPVGAKIIAFHGDPKPENALKGVWADDVVWFKKIYKHTKPASWLSDYISC